MEEHEKCEHCDDDCGCESSFEDLAAVADDKIDALIMLLVKKGVITEKEFDDSYDDLFEEETVVSEEKTE